eukprot:SAG22_NODE_5613_length_985_cov_0.860045_2_plen_74_part_00
MDLRPLLTIDNNVFVHPGSHKANLFPTAEMLTLEEDNDITVQPVLHPGDAVIFVRCAAGNLSPCLLSPAMSAS